MTRQQLLKKYESLSVSARRQVDTLIASLAEPQKQKAVRATVSVKTISGEPFIGMWRDRADMADSVEWVRSLRRRQWSRRIG
jgi:hypothetical protein